MPPNLPRKVPSRVRFGPLGAASFVRPSGGHTRMMGKADQLFGKLANNNLLAYAHYESSPLQPDEEEAYNVSSLVHGVQFHVVAPLNVLNRDRMTVTYERGRRVLQNAAVAYVLDRLASAGRSGAVTYTQIPAEAPITLEQYRDHLNLLAPRLPKDGPKLHLMNAVGTHIPTVEGLLEAVKLGGGRMGLTVSLLDHALALGRDPSRDDWIELFQRLGPRLAETVFVAGFRDRPGDERMSDFVEAGGPYFPDPNAIFAAIEALEVMGPPKPENARPAKAGAEMGKDQATKKPKREAADRPSLMASVTMPFTMLTTGGRTDNAAGNLHARYLRLRGIDPVKRLREIPDEYGQFDIRGLDRDEPKPTPPAASKAAPTAGTKAKARTPKTAKKAVTNAPKVAPKTHPKASKPAKKR